MDASAASQPTPAAIARREAKPWIPGDSVAVWRALVQDSGLAAVVVNFEGQLLFVNRFWCLMTGRSADDVIGHYLTDVLPAPIGGERLEILRRALSSGRPALVREIFEGRFLLTTIRPLASEPRTPRAAILTYHVGTQADGLLTAAAEYEPVIPRHHDFGRLATLTKRERQVFQLIGEGLSSMQIAHKLGRTPTTIEHHRGALAKKLGMHSRVEIAALGRNFRGIDLAAIEPPPPPLMPPAPAP